MLLTRAKKLRLYWSLSLGSLLLLAILAGLLRTRIKADQLSLRSEFFGVHAAIPALPSIEEKSLATAKVAEAGFGWIRHQFYYEESINFVNYDAAQQAAKARGLKTLGLLTFMGKDKSHQEWQNYVSTIVNHYKEDVAAWEIMNEIDNHLTPAEYVPYLKEAHALIKAANPGAKVVLSGLTSRPEAANFWDGVAAADGWNYFDAIGLHHYHRQFPERVNFGGGDLTAELSRPLAAINKYGGDKKIWVTEIGYIEEVGRQNQANWLARNMIIARSIPQIEKFFIYNLSNKFSDHPFGLLDTDLSEFPLYRQVKTTINELADLPTGERLFPVSQQNIDKMDSLAGWSVAERQKSQGEIALKSGFDQSAIELNYRFQANPAYILIGKNIPLGQPEAISAWFYGDNANNVWKFRFVDKKGEMWQADLGTLASGWSYKQFNFERDTAKVSWNGDKKIDYPITFDSIVVDRQGGLDHGVALIDSLSTIKSGADLMTYKFGNNLFYWKAEGQTSFNFCGRELTFTETPQKLSNVDCRSNLALPPPKLIKKPTLSQAIPAPTATPSASPALVDPNQSKVTVYGQKMKATGYDSYQVEVELKDAAGQAINEYRPELGSIASNLNTRDSRPVLIVSEPSNQNNRWLINVASVNPGYYPIQVLVNGVRLRQGNLGFLPTQSLTLNQDNLWVRLMSFLRTHPFAKILIWLAGLAFIGLTILLSSFILIFADKVSGRQQKSAE